MKTFRRHWIDYDKKTIACVDIIDIAHSLASQNRFIGHTVYPYSTAQHSILVSQMVLPYDALWGLLHDAAETYTGDIIRPVGYTQKLWDLEQAFQAQIAEAFGLPTPKPPKAVMDADNRMLVTEMRATAVYGQSDVIPVGAENSKPYPGLIIKPFKTAAEAERKFLRRFDQLYKK